MTSRTMYLHRESNSDLIFRRDLFYPLNYRGIVGRLCFVCAAHARWLPLGDIR